MFYRSEVCMGLTRTVCSVSHRATVRVSAGPCSNLEAYLGSSPSSVRLTAESSPCSYRTEVLIFLLAVDWELLSAPTGHPQFFFQVASSWLFVFKASRKIALVCQERVLSDIIMEVTSFCHILSITGKI